MLLLRSKVNFLVVPVLLFLFVLCREDPAGKEATLHDLSGKIIWSSVERPKCENPPDTCVNIVLYDSKTMELIKKVLYDCEWTQDTCSYTIPNITTGSYVVRVEVFSSLNKSPNKIIGQYTDANDSIKAGIIKLTSNQKEVKGIDIIIK